MSKTDPYANLNIDLSAVKKRAAKLRGVEVETPQEEPSEPISTGRQMSEETRESFRNLAAALAEESEQATEAEPVADGKVDLGELPEEVKASTAALEPTVFYRGTPIDNEAVRASIEARCAPLNFADLILRGRVQQHVSILEGRVEATFQSLKASDNLWIERKASKQQMEENFVSSAWLGYARLAMCLYAFNGDVLPTHEKGGAIDEAAFEEKLAFVVDLNERVTEVLLVNLGWFDDRVNQLFKDDFEALKNG